MAQHLVHYGTDYAFVPTEFHRGVFAVHNIKHEDHRFKESLTEYEHWMRRWVVTHTPTGRKAGWNLTRPQAVNLAKHLAAVLGETWLIDAEMAAEISEADRRSARKAIASWWEG